MIFCCFFFNDTATTEIYTLSLHDALPISQGATTPATAPTPAPPSAPTNSPPSSAPQAPTPAVPPAAAAADAAAAPAPIQGGPAGGCRAIDPVSSEKNLATRDDTRRGSDTRPCSACSCRAPARRRRGNPSAGPDRPRAATQRYSRHRLVHQALAEESGR